MAMTGPERKALGDRLLKRGWMTRLANQYRRSTSHVSRVIAGERRDEVVENAFARRVGRERFDLFPALNDMLAGVA